MEKLFNSRKIDTSKYKNCPVCGKKPDKVMVARFTNLDFIVMGSTKYSYKMTCYNCKENGIITETDEYESSMECEKAWNKGLINSADKEIAA